MMKKTLLLSLLLGFINLSANAQSFHAEFSYQSFRPFINFQVELGNYDHYQRNTYQTAYIKGYMDGVNNVYYDAYRFYELVRNIEAYEAGYRDGLRDRALFIRLKGYNRLSHRPFSYNDYYSPYYSVQIWLNQLSFTFIKAPAHRLPRYWSRRAHPRIKQYRHRVHNQRRYYTRFEKQYNRYNKQLRKRAKYNQQRQQKHHRNYSRQRTHSRIDRNKARKRIRNRAKKSRFKSERPAKRSREIRQSRSSNSPKVRARTRSKNHKVERKQNRREKVKRSRSNNKREKVRRSRSRSKKQKVKRSRSRKSKGKSRSRGGSRRGGGRGN